MAWFGGKKKPKRKPPVLEPVGAPPAVQAAPVAQPALEPVQPNQGVPAVQAMPATQPVVEVAPIGVVADNNVMTKFRDYLFYIMNDEIYRNKNYDTCMYL